MGHRMMNALGVGIAALVLGGAALAATGGVGADAVVLDAGVQPMTSSSPATEDAIAVTEARDEGALDQGEEAGQAHDDRGGEGFGAVRSVEARAFGACMRSSGGGREARAACGHLKPGPAHRNSAHPGRGPDGDKGEGRGPSGGSGRSGDSGVEEPKGRAPAAQDD
jgi:hypothetical protein